MATVAILAITAHATPRKGHIVGLGAVKRVSYSADDAETPAAPAQSKAQ